MEEHIPSLADNINEIKECFLHNKKHTFCVDCLERKSFDEDPCQLCRPFYAIPDNGCGGYSREYLMEKLVDLHQSFVEVERNLSCAEKTIDVPLGEQFILEGLRSNVAGLHVAWLDNKIYIMQSDRKSVRVFTDQTPITEFQTPIHIEKLVVINCMVASTLSKSIFISDRFCIWKIQLPDNKLSRIRVHPEPDHLSITLNDELLAVMGDTSYDIVIFSLENFSITKSISVPFHCFDICCAGQLPNENIIISYQEIQEDSLYQICILTAKGDVVKKFDPNMFESIPSNSWCPTYFSVIDDGWIVFVGDSIDNRLFVFNSQMTDCHLLSDVQLESNDIPQIVYIKERQQLLLCEERSHTIYLSMLHLSPCNLIRGRTTKSLLPANNKSRIKRKHEVKKNSTRNFQKLGLKKWR